MIRWVENRLQVDRNRNWIPLWWRFEEFNGSMILYKQMGWIPLMCIELSLTWCNCSKPAPWVLSMWPCKIISGIKITFVYIFLPIAPIKLKLGLQTEGRLVIAIHPPRSIKLSAQSIAGVSFCFSSYHRTWAAPTWIKLFFILSNFWKIISPPMLKFSKIRNWG
jgi:hypothetical protein